MERVAVIVINYRTPDLTVGCLESLESTMEEHPEWRVVVVDNCSGDDSVERLKATIAERAWSRWVELVPSPVNGGFSAGNNVGIRRVEAEYYLLLNSDARVFDGTIEALVDAMKRRPDVGAIGPRLQFEDGTAQVSCFRDRSIVSELLEAAATRPLDRAFGRFVVAMGVFDEPTEGEWVSFACVMIRREVVDTIGEMDEGYFLYLEDIDYCKRMRRAGWRVLHFPSAKAIHLRGGSASLKQDAVARRRLPRYFFESRSRYFGKFYGGVPGVILANVAWTGGRSLAWLRETFGSKAPHVSEKQTTDLWINWREPFRASSYVRSSD